jgi:hypothetical protein
MRGPLMRVVAALAALAALLAGCGGDTAGPETGVSVGDVWADAESLDGEVVTVSSAVQRIVSDRAFVLGGTEGGEPLLVVHAGTTEVIAQSPVRVTGVVRQALDLDNVVDFADEPTAYTIYETYGEEPYLEATAIDHLEG